MPLCADGRGGTGKRERRQKRVGLASLVAVDDAQRDDDGHAAEAEQRQDEPAVLEAARDDAAEEQRRVAGTSPRRLLRLTAVRPSVETARNSGASRAPVPDASCASLPSVRRSTARQR